MGLYLICTSPRTGGSVFSSTLAQTGLLGTPGSYIYTYPANEVLNKLNRDEFEKYLKTVLERLHQEQHITKKYSNDLYWLYETNIFQSLGSPIERLRFFYDHLKASNMFESLENIRTSPFGGENWGIKILSNDNNYDGGFNFLIRHLKNTAHNANKKSTLQLLQEVCVDIKFIWLIRRNKVRQGLSYWKADHTKKWHQYQKEAPKEKVKNFLPTKKELNKYVIQLALDDAHWEEFFTKNQIIPLTIVYEDFILNPDQTIKDVLNYLGIKPTKNTYFNSFSEFKMACDDSNDFINNYYKTSFFW
ncbi:MAG: Stf0 family sulfotransferase [Chitinophagales bacterium]